MNISPAETAGYSTLIETLSAPVAAPNEGAREAASFQTLLRQPDSAEPPAAQSEQRPASTEEELHQEAKESGASPDKPVAAADNDREPVEDSPQELVAVAVPVMPFQPMTVASGGSEGIEAEAEPAVSGVSVQAQPRAAPALELPVTPADIRAEGEAQDEQAQPQLPAGVGLSPGDGLPPLEPGEQPVLAAEADEALATEVLADASAAENGTREDKEDAKQTSHQHDVQPESPPSKQAALDLPVAAGSGEGVAAANQSAGADAGGSDLRLNSDQPLPRQVGAPTAPQAAPPPTVRLPAELVAPPGGQSGREPQAMQIDTVRLLQRVARAFSAAPDGGEVRIRLSPPELGALRMEVRVLEGALVARLETETAAARTAIVENLPALRERLAEQGVRIERFDVDLMQRHTGGSPDRPADRQPPEPLPLSPALRPRRMPQVAEGVVARRVIAGDSSAGRLNVIV